MEPREAHDEGEGSGCNGAGQDVGVALCLGPGQEEGCLRALGEDVGLLCRVRRVRVAGTYAGHRLQPVPKEMVARA